MEVTDSVMWRKSTYSSGGANNCVEVGRAARSVAVRDTKERHLGEGSRMVLSVSTGAWTAFVSGLK